MSDRQDRLNQWIVVAGVILLVNLGIVMPLVCAANRLGLAAAEALDSVEPEPPAVDEAPTDARSPNIALIRP